MKEEVIVETVVEGSDKAVKQLDAVADATKGEKEESADYADELKDTAGELELFGVSLNGIRGAFSSLKTGFAGAIKSLGAFKTALAATGIGLILIAFASLNAWLKNTKGGMEFLNKATAALGAVVSTLTGVLVKMGTALSKIFSQSIITTIKEMAGAFDGVKNSMLLTLAITLDLQDAINKLSEDTARATSLTAFYSLELSKNKRIAEDVTKDIGTRIKAQENVIALQEKQLKINQDLADQNLAIVQADVNEQKRRNGETEATIAQLQLIADATAAVFEVQAANEEARIESQNKYNELIQTSRDEYLAGAAKVSDVEISIVKKTTKEIENDFDEREQLQLNFNRRFLDNTREMKETEQKIWEEGAELILADSANLFGAVAGLAGQNTEAGKALAIAQATINAYLGVSGVWGAFANPALPPFTVFGAVAQTAAVLASALTTVKQIQSIPIPKVQVVDTPFGDGGLIRGESHARGGVWINAEGGEGVINRRAMSVPWVRAEASRLNEVGGGVKFANGGVVAPNGLGLDMFNLQRAIAASRTVLVTEDLRAVQNTTLVTESIARL